MQFSDHTKETAMLTCIRMAHEAQLPLRAVTTVLCGCEPLPFDLWQALNNIQTTQDARAAYWTCHESYFRDLGDANRFKAAVLDRCLDVAKTFEEASWARSFAMTPNQKSGALVKMSVFGTELVAQAQTVAELIKFHEGYLWNLGQDELSGLAGATLSRALELATSREEILKVYYKAREGSSIRSDAIRKLAASHYGLEA